MIFFPKSIHLGKKREEKNEWNFLRSEGSLRDSTYLKTVIMKALPGRLMAKVGHQFPRGCDSRVAPPMLKPLITGSLRKGCVLLGQIVAMDKMMGNSNWNVQIQLKRCSE